MKGGFGCSPCCGPTCEECTRECQNPHTGTAFETVYTLYFEGAEAGNPSDGYLDATGDSDTSDPYDGMDGNGPWSQTVSGTFSLTKTTTRYPCYLTVSFWRSNFVLGANTIPPPATTLTTELITVTNQTSSEGAIYAGGFLLQPGESHQFDMTIPLVSGAGDQSTNDPGLYNGTIRVGAACVNDYVSFTVSGNIAWNVKKRQHVLYGRVRECYEEPGAAPCSGLCTGSSIADTIYLEIKNVSIQAGTTIGGISGTYVLDRVPNFCDWYEYEADAICRAGVFVINPKDIIEATSAALVGPYLMRVVTTSDNVSRCGIVSFAVEFDEVAPYCGTGVIKSGTGGKINLIAEDITLREIGTFDWEITA